jgi:hypothetical protein
VAVSGQVHHGEKQRRVGAIGETIMRLSLFPINGLGKVF